MSLIHHTRGKKKKIGENGNVKPTKAGMKKYLDIAAMLKPMLAGFEGFIRAERFSSLNEEGKLLSMNVWTDEAVQSIF